mmetsp:Transcript_78112/g.181227  ORF Transcript_78112/g.181227 Transcript_78112/m.181227 type:complete len:283 (+) Transcript_78112:581-1429(+)
MSSMQGDCNSRQQGGLDKGQRCPSYPSIMPPDLFERNLTWALLDVGLPLARDPPSFDHPFREAERAAQEGQALGQHQQEQDHVSKIQDGENERQQPLKQLGFCETKDDGGQHGATPKAHVDREEDPGLQGGMLIAGAQRHQHEVHLGEHAGAKAPNHVSEPQHEGATQQLYQDSNEVPRQEEGETEHQPTHILERCALARHPQRQRHWQMRASGERVKKCHCCNRVAVAPGSLRHAGTSGGDHSGRVHREKPASDEAEPLDTRLWWDRLAIVHNSAKMQSAL